CTKGQTATACRSSYYLSSGSCPSCSDLASGFYPNSANNNSTGAGACYLTTDAGKYVAVANNNQTTCPVNNYCPANVQVYYGQTSTPTACATGLYAPAGMWELAQCGHILHIGDQSMYLRSTKQTTPSLNAKIGDAVFYGNMTTSDVPMTNGTTKKLKLRYNDTTYSVYDDTVQIIPEIFADCDAADIGIGDTAIYTCGVPEEPEMIGTVPNIHGKVMYELDDGNGGCSAAHPTGITKGDVVATSVIGSTPGTNCYCPKFDGTGFVYLGQSNDYFTDNPDPMYIDSCQCPSACADEINNNSAFRATVFGV
ncbi:MAG: hypothetical protein J5608_01860, partial [Alphaproteobacteria bacterium]|nr:hypothetical protein [Alphaproteobacteria bacterium]